MLEYLDKYADAYVVLGTTGEPYTLSASEKEEVVRFVLQRRGQKQVIVGVEGNDTALACQNAKHWQKAGAEALLCITPYCNKCTQSGIVAHYSALSRAVDIPLVVYNVPSRTGVNVSCDTLERLLEIPSVSGVKEASGDPDQIARYAVLCRKCQRDLYCGDDALLPLFRVLGAQGVISAAANAVPQVIRKGWYAPLPELADWNSRYKALFSALFSVVNPIGIKYACWLRGLCANRLRLPLTPLRQDESLQQAMAPFAVKNGLPKSLDR